MTVREYIGARYVPLFADPIEWNINTVYEPLTVVKYQGASYVSRRSVPEGIALDNTDYWILWADYNAQIEAYRQEVRAFDGRITANENAINDLEDKFPVTTSDIADSAVTLPKLASSVQSVLTGLRTDINTINANSWVTESRIAANAVTNSKLAANAVSTSKIVDGNVTKDKIANGAISQQKLDSALSNTINSLLNGINPYAFFNGYNVVFIGDSFTYGTGASDHLQPNGDTKRFSTILANKLNMHEFNYGVGSTGFCDPGSGGQNAPFKKQVLNAVSGMTDTERNNTRLVVIAGGVNDFNEGSLYSASDMQSGAHDAVVNAINGFPNAIVLLVPMLFKGHSANARLFNYENACIEGINYYNGTRRAVYIKGAWTWNYGMASHFASDKLHPNDLGHRIIANTIYSHVFGGIAYENRLIGFEFETGFSSTTDFGGYYQFMNGMMINQGMRLTVAAVSENTTTKFAQLDSGFAPLMNVNGTIMQGNVIHGTWQITPSGACYITPDVSYKADTQIFLSPVSWLPSGSY